MLKRNVLPKMIRTFYGETMVFLDMVTWTTILNLCINFSIDIFQNIIILPSLYMINCPKTWHLKVQYVTFDPLVVK